MAIALKDLDQILGYDPTTHSFSGLPSINSQSQLSPADRKTENTALSLPKMGPSLAQGANPNTQYRQPMAPGRFDLNAAQPTQRTAMPSMAAEAPNIQQAGPTGLPSMTSPEAPSNIAKPKESFWQKLGHGFETAGDVVAPNLTQRIPGTELNKQWQAQRASKLAEEQARTGLTEAQAEQIKKGEEEVPFTPFGATEPIQVPWRALGQLESAKEKAGATQGAANTRAQTALQIAGLKADSPEGKAKLASLGYKLGDDGNIVPIPESEMSPQQKQRRDLNQSVIDLHEAQVAVDQAKNDPNSPQFKLAQQRLAFAQQNAQRMAEALGLHQQEFENKLHEQGLVKPSGQTVSRSDAAGAALEQLPALEDEIRKNADSLGPIMGRIQSGEIAIGDVNPKIAKLYSTLESFYSQQPAIHGFRNAEFVKDFDTFIGSLRTNPEATIAGLEGLRPTLEAVEKSGRTYRKRIVEGEGGGGEFKVPEGAPSAKGVADGKVLRDDKGNVIARAKGGEWAKP